MKLTILSPEKELLNCEVTAVELPGAKGRFMVLSGHAPLMTLLQSGTVKYDRTGADSRQEITITGGFAQVMNDVITVCVG
ncbi:MAG: ATP synthase F1 subunit epsilon [Bacteroidia bacterium]|nr:ATP synthase F1 subunit epsilon [Bacteroidia bacterium]